MPLDNPFYTAEMQGPFTLHSIGRFELEDGGVIADLELAVATYGELNDAKDNAIIAPTRLLLAQCTRVSASPASASSRLN